MQKMLAVYGNSAFRLPSQIQSYTSLLAILSQQLRDATLRTLPMDFLSVLSNLLRMEENSILDDAEVPRNLADELRLRAGSITKETRQREYDDLGLLLEMGYAAFGVKKVMGSDAVKHLLERARNRKEKQIKEASFPPLARHVRNTKRRLSRDAN